MIDKETQEKMRKKCRAFYDKLALNKNLTDFFSARPTTETPSSQDASDDKSTENEDNLDEPKNN